MQYRKNHNIYTSIFSLLCLSLTSMMGCTSNSVTRSADFNYETHRPAYLISQMHDSDLKDQLKNCQTKKPVRTSFSIAHRGAPLKFPEHTRESFLAAIEQGAGMHECDVVSTKDRELVCRHSYCDLHETTNILETGLANKCRTMDELTSCCVSDLTLEEYRSLLGKKHDKTGKLMTHAESISLFDQFNLEFTPEIKRPLPDNSVLELEELVETVIEEYSTANIDPEKVYIQTADLEILQILLQTGSPYTQNLVLLDFRYEFQPDYVPTLEEFRRLKQMGVNNIAPPIPALLTLDDDKKIIASEYALRAKQADLNILTWSLERSGHLVNDMKNGDGSVFYYQSILPAIKSDGDAYKVLDVLAKEVGVIGVFSDWPETVTYYANCMGL